MDYEILHKPSYALARVRLNQREQLQAETGAMVSMSDSIKMDTSTRGGIFGGLRRSVLGGESFFVNTFTADQAGRSNLGAVACRGTSRRWSCRARPSWSSRVPFWPLP